MTTRYGSITLTLDGDYRAEDLEDLLSACEQFGIVLDAEPQPMTSVERRAMMRSQRQLKEQLWEVLRG